jgi:hypothetical protein
MRNKASDRRSNPKISASLCLNDFVIIAIG